MRRRGRIVALDEESIDREAPADDDDDDMRAAASVLGRWLAKMIDTA
jgi:hypothetical protein